MNEMRFVYTHRASPELVFTCLTTPAHLTHFWGPPGTTAPAADIRIELRPGGRFDAVILSDSDGSRHEMHAVYVEVDRPNRLVWREQIGTDEYMITSISLRGIGDDSTEVVTHVVGMPAAVANPESQAGFRSSLDRFSDYLSSIL